MRIPPQPASEPPTLTTRKTPFGGAKSVVRTVAAPFGSNPSSWFQAARIAWTTGSSKASRSASKWTRIS